MFIRHLVFSPVFLAAGLGIAAAQSSSVAAKPSATDKIPHTGVTYLQPQPFDLKTLPLPLSVPPESACYTLRTYQFAPRDPSSSDSPMALKSETTCQSMALFQMKDILALPPKAQH